MNDCPSDLVLDRWLAGDGAAEAQAAHLASCPRCRDRVEALRAFGAAAGSRVERALAAARAAPELRARRWAWWPLAGAAVAALLLAVVFAGGSAVDRSPEPPGIRIKGSSVRAFVRRGSEVSVVQAGQRFRPKDALRFVVTSAAPAEFLLVGIEADSGAVLAYHPFGASRSVPLGAVNELALEGSLILDDSPGDEYLAAIFADRPFDLEGVRRAVAEARAEYGSSFEAVQRAALPGSVHWIHLPKEVTR
jgi:hypothetical protein